MKKKHKSACRFCEAKTVLQYCFRGQMMCHDCLVEYSQMIDGTVSKRREKSNNPLFDAFVRGWESVERENNLKQIEIPKGIKDWYKQNDIH